MVYAALLKTEIDPRIQFYTVLKVEMGNRNLDIETLASITKIPLNRLRRIMSGAPGTIRMVDMLILATEFGICVEAFFGG